MKKVKVKIISDSDMHKFQKKVENYINKHPTIGIYYNKADEYSCMLVYVVETQDKKKESNTTGSNKH